MDLGGRVRAERERLGLLREELIGMMGELRMDRNTLWHIKAGRTKNPRADQIIALSRALGVSADYLLGLTGTLTPPRRRRPQQTVPVAMDEEDSHG